MNKIIIVSVNKDIIRNKDCNPFAGVRASEDELYYKFFNEWKDVTHVQYKGNFHKLHRDSYNGVVTFASAKYKLVEEK